MIKYNGYNVLQIYGQNKLYKWLQLTLSGKIKNPRGPSFLLNPEAINKVKSPRAINQYIYLASLRNFWDYSAYGSTALDLRLFPEISRETIIWNPYLSLTENYVTFYFEQEI